MQETKNVFYWLVCLFKKEANCIPIHAKTLFCNILSVYKDHAWSCSIHANLLISLFTSECYGQNFSVRTWIVMRNKLCIHEDFCQYLSHVQWFTIENYLEWHHFVSLLLRFCNKICYNILLFPLICFYDANAFSRT